MSRLLTILFGALPASVVALWAILGIMVGISLLFTENFLAGLVVIPWSLAGIWGTGALWAVAFNVYSDRVVAGLVVGTVLVAIALAAFSERLDTMRLW